MAESPKEDRLLPVRIGDEFVCYRIPRLSPNPSPKSCATGSGSICRGGRSDVGSESRLNLPDLLGRFLEEGNDVRKLLPGEAVSKVSMYVQIVAVSTLRNFLERKSAKNRETC